MTGWNWNGKDDCFRIDPSQFGGIEFHPDAVTDCGWEATNRMTDTDRSQKRHLCDTVAGRTRYRHRRRIYRVRCTANDADRKTLLSGAHGKLPCIRQRAPEFRRTDHPADDRTTTGRHRSRCRDLRTPRIRTFDLRSLRRRSWRLLLFLSTPNHQHATEIPHVEHEYHVAISRRPFDCGLDRPYGLRMRLHHR